jgi:hypothetical protein
MLSRKCAGRNGSGGRLAVGALAQGKGRCAEDAAHVCGEMALVREADGVGDFGEGKMGLGEQGAGALDAAADDVLVE